MIHYIISLLFPSYNATYILISWSTIRTTKKVAQYMSNISLLSQQNGLDSCNSNHCNHHSFGEHIQNHFAASPLQRVRVCIGKLHPSEEITRTQNVYQLRHHKAGQEHGSDDICPLLIHVESSPLSAVEFANGAIIFQENVWGRCGCIIVLLLGINCTIALDLVHVLIWPADSSTGPCTIRVDGVITSREVHNVPCRIEPSQIMICQ